MAQHPALHVDEAGDADADGAGRAVRRSRCRRASKTRSAVSTTPSAPGRVDLRTWARIVPSVVEHDAVRLGAADVETDRPRACHCGAHRVHPASRNTSTTAATPGPDEPRVLILASPTSYAPASPTRRPPPGGRPPPASAGGRAPRGAGGRRAPARRGGRRREVRSGRAARRASRPHATSPTAMLAAVSTLTTRAPARSGQVAVDEQRGGRRARPAAARPAAPAPPTWAARPSRRTRATASARRRVRRAGRRRPRRRSRRGSRRPARRACRVRCRAGRSRRPAPARTPPGCRGSADAPAMSSASLTMTPSNSSTSRSMASTTGLSVAGRSGSRAGTTMCEVITAAVPASTAASNGTSSREARVVGVDVDPRQGRGGCRWRCRRGRGSAWRTPRRPSTAGPGSRRPRARRPARGRRRSCGCRSPGCRGRC